MVTIVSLTRQLSEATNDFGRTIESPANEMRILNEQWERLSRAIGNLFMPILAKILPYLNAILMVLTEIINTVATLFGFNTDDYDYFSGIADSVLDLEEGLDGASESAKKLKQGLRGFDKLNVITTPTSGSTGLATGGTGSVDPKIWEAFNDAFDKYNSKLENVQMKATKIRDTIMEWLGFTKEIDDVTGDVSFKFDHITGGTVLGALGVGGFIFSGIKTIYNILKKIGLINFGSKIKKIYTLLGKLGTKLGIGGISSTVTIAGIIAFIVTKTISIVDQVKKLADAIKNNKLSDFFKIDGLGDLIEKIFLLTSFITEGHIVLGLFLGRLGIFDNTINIVKEALQPLIEKFTNLGNYIKNELLKIWKEDLEPTFLRIKEIWEKYIKPVLDEVGKYMKELFINSGLLKTGFDILLTFISNTFVNGIILAFNIITTPIKIFFETVKTTIKGITQTFRGIIDFIEGVFTGDWRKAWVGVKEIFLGIWTSVTAPFKGIINGLLSVLENFANYGIRAVNSVIKALNKISVDIPDWVPELGGQKWGINISTIKEIKIPRLKTGLDYVPKDYYLAYLDEGERVLTKEENRAYMNNEMMGQNYQNKQTSFNPTFIIQVGDKEVARKVLNDLQDMAKSNGKPIMIS